MSEEIQDNFSMMDSAVRFTPISNLRFIAEELRRYGIKTNKVNNKDKTVFFQSAHIVADFNKDADGIVYPSYSLVSFKDLFKVIGKNPEGVDEQDIVRIWVIAEKLEKRRIIEIKGTSKELLGKEDTPNIPDVYANLHHVHRGEESKVSYIYKSKFATNKSYPTDNGTLTGIGDYFIIK